jgi:hypothetical protein
MFSTKLTHIPTVIEYQTSPDVKKHVVTGMAASEGYSVTQQRRGGNLLVIIRKGGSEKSDKGGVLVFDTK